MIIRRIPDKCKPFMEIEKHCGGSTWKSLFYSDKKYLIFILENNLVHFCHHPISFLESILVLNEIFKMQKFRKIINHEVDFSEPFDKISDSGLALGMLLNILGFDYFYCHLISSIKFNLSNIFNCPPPSPTYSLCLHIPNWSWVCKY